MKKVISMILIMALCVTCFVTPAIAANVSDNEMSVGVQKEEDGSLILYDATVPESYVQARDLENGDAVFLQYRDGIVVSQYTVNRSENLIEAIYYDGDVAQNKVIQTPQTTKESGELLRATTTKRLGYVLYEYTAGSQVGLCGTYVDYVKNTGSIKYDITGTYRDLAGLASFIAGVLALPSAPALVVSKKVLGWFSLTAGASFFVPPCELDSNYEQIEYNLTDRANSGHKNSFYGTKYTVTQEGKHYNEVFKEGTYYPTSSWGDSTFGITIYQHMFAYDSWSIYRWYSA